MCPNQTRHRLSFCVPAIYVWCSSNGKKRAIIAACVTGLVILAEANIHNRCRDEITKWLLCVCDCVRFNMHIAVRPAVLSTFVEGSQTTSSR